MNYSHIHIVLNHFPTIGTFFGLALFLYALWKKKQDMQIASFVIFMVRAVLVIPTCITGAAAEGIISQRPGVNPTLVALHQDAAIVAFTLLVLTGTFAWLALWQYRRFNAPSQWTVWTVMGLAIITMAMMMQTATLGGEISHPEIRAEGVAEVTAPPEGEEGIAYALQMWMVNNAWVWPTGETLHFTGMTLLFGVMFLVNFRLLGMLRGVPFSAIHRFLPLGILGFGVTMTSGVLMFNADFHRYVAVPTFFLKMFLIVVAGISVLYVTIFDDTWALGKGDGTALRHKIFAVTNTLLWLGAMYFGRMIPYLE